VAADAAAHMVLAETTVTRWIGFFLIPHINALPRTAHIVPEYEEQHDSDNDPNRCWQDVHRIPL
jgi:hypothetical protein